MIVEEDAEYNFVYLLPPIEGKPQRVMVPSQLQMGWTESAAFFTTASQGAANLPEELLKDPTTLADLGPHPLEHHALPANLDMPNSPNPLLPPTTLAELVDRLLTVFIDDFYHLLAIKGEPSDAIEKATRALFHSIHAIFPPPAVTGHVNGKDPMSQKKLEKGDAKWQWEKELLGFLFNGLQRTVQLPKDKAEKSTKQARQTRSTDLFPSS